MCSFIFLPGFQNLQHKHSSSSLHMHFKNVEKCSREMLLSGVLLQLWKEPWFFIALYCLYVCIVWTLFVVNKDFIFFVHRDTEMFLCFLLNVSFQNKSLNLLPTLKNKLDSLNFIQKTVSNVYDAGTVQDFSFSYFWEKISCRSTRCSVWFLVGFELFIGQNWRLRKKVRLWIES